MYTNVNTKNTRYIISIINIIYIYIYNKISTNVNIVQMFKIQSYVHLYTKLVLITLLNPF